MPLVYLPDAGALFSWGDVLGGAALPPELSAIEREAAPRSATIVTPAGPREVLWGSRFGRSRRYDESGG